MKKLYFITGLALGFSGLSAFGAAAGDIALNMPVSIVSGAAQISNPSTPVSVIDDGIFTPEATAYGTAAPKAVEWGTTNGQGVASNNSNTDTVLEIDLGTDYTVDGAMLQGDDNDSYLLQYFNESTSTWATLWNVPSVSSGQGLRTRGASVGDQSDYFSVGPVITDAVRISTGPSGDAGMAVAEVELHGTLAPTPAAANIALGFLGALSLRRSRSRRLA